jgi:4-aminobutyrate aminotransferase-like enzyme
MAVAFGTALPEIIGPVPGPRSRELSVRLARVESRNITTTAPPPIFWSAARGANVRDADGNTYIDLTAGFSVAAAGHANAAVARAISAQSRKLPHALGDVYPADIKVELLERLAQCAPPRLDVAILASAGAEAVEAALKTALLHSGKPGVLAFEGGYHGLTYGALAATSRAEFRTPFQAQLFAGVRFAPFPAQHDDAQAALAEARQNIEEAARAGAPTGALLVEPLQGRGGIIVPADGFLAGLRSICDRSGIVLIFDEIYTGLGRTGRWFACEHSGVVPDIITLGKALSGALPFSAAIGRRDIMDAWPASTGEAIHTSTFLGNPIACAAALAHLREIEARRLVERAHELGGWLRRKLERWRRYAAVTDVRGAGLMQGVEIRSREGDGALVVARRALERGIILLAEGPSANVLAFTPPLVITRRQLGFALDVIEDEISSLSPP